MKKRNCLLQKSFAFLTSFVLLISLFPYTALADGYTATTMRLLHYEGTVEIEDASGSPRAVMENVRFDSGEAMKTAEVSSASVGLDDGRIVTLDEKSRVEFEKQNGAVSMNLTEGRIFLDVSKKLDSNETMDIKTSTMSVGIRGTIVYISSQPVTDDTAADMKSVDLEGLSPDKGSIISISQIGVLEGTAQITYMDNSSQEHSVSVEAGKKATVPEYSEDAEGIPEVSVSDITAEELEGFVLNQVTSDEALLNRVKDACDVVDDIDPSGRSGIYTADGDWTWDSPVTLVAQSASKYYDGQPLTRTSDILVNGLPSIFSVKASAGGSRTDAGESENPVANYSIYNNSGEDITRHFTNIETVSGTLLVVPAPLTIHTGTAEKVYDGTPLTSPEAYVTFYKGSASREVPWRNTSYVVTEPTESASYDSQTLYGICGVIRVNAANPLTGERREIELRAGQKLSVFLSDLDGRQSIELKIENLTENDLPEELLRLYGDNPALLEQACRDTRWNIELMRRLIEALPEDSSGTATIEQGGLVIRETESDRLMQDLTNVRITIDTEITDYNNRALGSEEAHYSSLAVDESIRVTATGSQTNVGTSTNTYTIDWGSANRSNYEVGEDLGTLTVTPASATVSTGSAEKTYDGTPLTNSEASISGLVNGETATVTATGSITKEGSAENSYSISWGSADPGNYSVSENLGVLRVTAAKGTVTLTSASAEKTYDGTALTDNSVTAEGLPDGFTVSARVSGSQTDAGSSDNTITSYTIYDADGNDATGQFPRVITQNGTLTVKPLPVEFNLYLYGEVDEEHADEGEAEDPGLSVVYDGYAFIPEWIRVSYEGADGYLDPEEWESDAELGGSYSFTFALPGDAKLKLDGTGYTDAGSYTFVPERTFLEGNGNNYEITFTHNRLTIAPAPLTINASGSKVYDGEPLNGSDVVSVEGLAEMDSITVTATGTITDAGTADNPYTIDWGGTDPNNYSVSEEPGKLTVDPVEVVLIADCSVAVSGDIEVGEFGIKVQVNNVDPSQYQVYRLDEENLWHIDWAWGDKTEVSTFLIKDETTWAITTLFYMTSGDYSNYSVEKVDQEGSFDIPPIYGLTGGTGKSSSSGTGFKTLSLTKDQTDTGSDDDDVPDEHAQSEELIEAEEPETEETEIKETETEESETEETEIKETETEEAETKETEIAEPEKEETEAEETEKEETEKEETEKEETEATEPETEESEAGEAEETS